jgi:hypothetical protein
LTRRASKNTTGYIGSSGRALPGSDLGHHGIGDRTDELRRDLRAVLLGQEALDLAHVMPRAYMATILSSKPVKRRSCLGIRIGSKLPARSRGTSIRSGPSSVRTVLPLTPLRWLPTSPAFSRRAVAQVMAQFGSQRTLDQRLLEGHRGGIHRLGAHRATDKLVNAALSEWSAAPPPVSSCSSCLAYMLLSNNMLCLTHKISDRLQAFQALVLSLRCRWAPL